MTETDTRDGLSLLFAALAVLTPIAILGVIAAVGSTGGEVPHGVAILLYSVPAVLLVVALAVGTRLAGHR